MSDGVVHVSASLLLVAGFGVGAIAVQDPRLLECSLGALAGILLSPDLDVDKTYIGNKLLRKKIGWVADSLWNLLWSPYKRSFKHGQFASHFPIYSTFIRLSYVYFWLIFVPHSLVKLLGLFQWELMYVLSWYSILFLSPTFFMGLAGSDIIHYVLDKLTRNSK